MLPCLAAAWVVNGLFFHCRLLKRGLTCYRPYVRVAFLNAVINSHEMKYPQVMRLVTWDTAFKNNYV